MMLEQLREQVCAANRSLPEHGLVTLTWGNVSGIDRESNLVAIKPSGVDYTVLQPEQIVIVDLEGNVVEGDLRPSSDTPTHVHLYASFPDVGGICHTHSKHATIFAQAREPIPCCGTTHADHFMGTIPVTRQLTPEEVDKAYERNTGLVIAEAFAALQPLEMPGVLVAGHAPFTWGKTVVESVKNAVALEAIAEMLLGMRKLREFPNLLEEFVLKKHSERKHGPNAYYGQRK